MDDLETVEFADVLGAIAEYQHLTRCAQVCFTGTEADQAEQHGTIDELGDQDLEQGGDALEEADREADLLEQMPLHPESEKERLASWLRLSRRARVAIRRLHRNLRHLPTERLVRAARAPRRYINDVKTFRCQGCDNAKPIPQTHKVFPPRPYTFNHEVGVDVFEMVDSIFMRFSIMNAVCIGTTYDQAWIVRESESLGSPSSHARLRPFVHGWTHWASWPKLDRCDQGTHNGGVFGSTLAKNGVVISPAGLEAPEQLGRLERRGAMLKKKMMSKVIKDTHASGRESMDMILSECLNAANEMTRHGGFAPAQWVLSRLPRNPATMGDEDECLDAGALQAYADGPTTCGVQSHYRAEEREAFVRWDVDERVRRAALQKAAPVFGSYQVGDIVSYCREARAGEHGLQWSVGSRLIGFEKDRNSLGETQPRTCWTICDSFLFVLPLIVYDKQHERSLKQARTARNGVETVQDYLFQQGHCEHQRNGFLHVRMAGLRKSNKKVLKKDGQRNLHFPSCTLDVQAALRGTRRIEWNKWMKFSAGILTDEEVRRLTEVGCEIYPINGSIQTKTRMYEEMTIMSLCPQSTRVDWLVAETWRRQKDFAQNLQLMMWIRTILFAVGVLGLTSPFTHANSRTDTFSGKKLIGSCCIVFQLKVSQKKELQADNVWPCVFPSTVQKMQDEDCGFDGRTLANSSNFSVNQILPNLFTLRDDESRICMAISRKELKP